MTKFKHKLMMEAFVKAEVGRLIYFMFFAYAFSRIGRRPDSIQYRFFRFKMYRAVKRCVVHSIETRPGNHLKVVR